MKTPNQSAQFLAQLTELSESTLNMAEFLLDLQFPLSQLPPNGINATSIEAFNAEIETHIRTAHAIHTTLHSISRLMQDHLDPVAPNNP